MTRDPTQTPHELSPSAEAEDTSAAPASSPPTPTRTDVRLRPVGATPRVSAKAEVVHADALQSRVEAVSPMGAKFARPSRPADADAFASLERTDPDRQLDPDAWQAARPSAYAEDGAGDGALVPAEARTTPAPAPAERNDPVLNSYIASLNLAELDLSEVELPPAPRASVVTLACCAAVGACCLVAMLWLPTTALYQLHATGEALFWGCAATAAGAAWVGRRHLGAARELADMVTAPGGPRLPSLPTSLPRPLRRLLRDRRLQARLLAWRRPSMVVAIAGMAACVAFVLPRDAEWQGSTYSTAWFVAVVVSMGCGVLVGRFILAQAAATPLSGELRPWVLPPWLRWVNLALLVAGGLVTNFGAQWFGLGGSGGEFSLSGLGLATGIGGAIWMARRFDELETKWREEARQKVVQAQPQEGEETAPETTPDGPF